MIAKCAMCNETLYRAYLSKGVESMKIAAIEVITITGQEAVWYFEEDAFNLNAMMDDARTKSGIFTATPLHGTRGKVNLNLALFISDARELTDEERVKFDEQS